MFRFGNWEKYIGIAEKDDAPGISGDPAILRGQLYAVMYPGYPVPCSIGAKIELRPPPRTYELNYSSDNCMSGPSSAFQIFVSQGSISGCATVLQGGYSGSPAVVSVKPCTSINDKSQQFTLQEQGCD